MLIVFLTVCLQFVYSELIPYAGNKNSPCIIGILQKYYINSHLVYIDINSEEFENVQNIHEAKLKVISRKVNHKTAAYIDGYFIQANNASSFVSDFVHITHETTWNPNSKFLIILEKLDEMMIIFDQLLKYHVTNVVLLSESYMYTYNPFENHACGKYYEKIIPLGNCLDSIDGLFSDYSVDGLKNCTLNIGTPHWPPYAIYGNHAESNLNMGAEQYLLKIICDKEQIHVNFTYNYDPENFGTITLDLAADGPMVMLQNNQTDLMLGGLLLTPSRAAVFDYIHGHLDYSDEVKIAVKRASLVPLWKQFFTEFKPAVWGLVFIVLTIYSSLFIMLLRAKDKCYIFMKMLDVMLLHGYNFRGSMILKFIFMFWLVFAYMMNCFYQTILTSLTTKPSVSYQISVEEDLNLYHLKPCLSSVMLKYRQDVSRYLFSDANNTDEGCKGFLDSIKTVGNSYNLYTLVFYSVFSYNENMFLNEWGESSVYVLPKPVSKIIYAMYSYKGFPLHKFKVHALRLRENGIVNKALQDQYYIQMIQHHYRMRTFTSRIVVPWLIYAVGTLSACLTCALEYIYNHYHSRRLY